MTETMPPARAARTDAAADSRADFVESLPTCRRGFLSGLAKGAAGAAALSVGAGLLTPAPAAAALPRALGFESLHTGEALEEIYWIDGTYRPQGLARINHILRDWRTGDVTDMDPALLDLLYDLRSTLGSEERFHVISGYRSPKTNAKLASNSSGVAKKSFHMRGMAIDVALPGRDLVDLRDAAWALQRGGVGYYPKSGFVHVDTGPVRRWNF